MSDECREAFEKVAEREGYCLAVIKTEPPKFHEGDTQTAWLFWQAAWNARTPADALKDQEPL